MQQSAATRPYPGREFEALPADWLTPWEPLPPPAQAYINLCQKLMDGPGEDALPLYRQMLHDLPPDSPLGALASVAIVRSLLMADSPEINEAITVVSNQDEAVRKANLSTAAHDEWRWLCLLAHLGEAPSRVGDENAFIAWRARLKDRLKDLRDRESLHDALVEFVGRMVEGFQSSAFITPEALEEVTMDIQCAVPWPSLLQRIQQQRLGMLLADGRYEQALFEARVLLAVSSQDAKTWLSAVQQMTQVMKAAQLEEATAGDIRCFLTTGAMGVDEPAAARASQANPLSTCERRNDYLLSILADLHPTAAADPYASIKMGYVMLLAGQGMDARQCFIRLTQTCDRPSDRLCEQVLGGIGMAETLIHGSLAQAEQFASALAASPDDRDIASPVWCLAARQYLQGREDLVQDLIRRKQYDLAMAICRPIADGWIDPARGRSALSLALQACCSGSAEPASSEVLQQFRVFGERLHHPEARAYAAYLAARRYNEAGDVTSALEELQRAQKMSAAALRDPECTLLYAYLLTRLNRLDEALPVVSGLCKHLDLDRDLTTRSQWLLGIIHIQQGEKLQARRILSQMIDEDAGHELAARARELITNL